MNRSRLKTVTHEMCPLELALFDADILASIAPYLAAADLTNLASTCRTFGIGSRGDNNDDEGGTLPLVQEAARRAILGEQSKMEKAALVRYPGESWISVYQQLLMLREPLIFDVLVGKDLEYAYTWTGTAGKSLEYEDGNKSRVISNAINSSWRLRDELRTKSAISTHILRGGKHYAEFSEARGAASVGIMRPIPSSGLGKLEEFHPLFPAYLTKEIKQALSRERSKRWGASNINCCMFDFESGLCIYSNWEENQPNRNEWEGQERICSGVLGLLLDLDAGTLTAYKDGHRLGGMCEGLTGEYCWVASMFGAAGSISIKRGDIPDDA